MKKFTSVVLMTMVLVAGIFAKTKKEKPTYNYSYVLSYQSDSTNEELTNQFLKRIESTIKANRNMFHAQSKKYIKEIRKQGTPIDRIDIAEVVFISNDYKTFDSVELHVVTKTDGSVYSYVSTSTDSGEHYQSNIFWGEGYTQYLRNEDLKFDPNHKMKAIYTETVADSGFGRAK